MREVIGEAGQVGRLGGDEFEVVLPATSVKDDLSSLAQGIIDSLSRPYTINGTAVSIGASVGIVTSDYDDRTSDDLMRDADLALYAAKAAGKGCFRFFAPEMHEAARERQLMESDLRVALEKDQLRLVFQPCVDASSEAVTGFEALDPLAPPRTRPGQSGEFIPLAEEIGLINEIGEWVLRTACEEAAKWPEHVSVAVNLRQSSSAARAAGHGPGHARETGLPAKRLELEITEGVFLSNDEHVHEMIASLKTIGVKLALDDFGQAIRASAICSASRSTRSRSTRLRARRVGSREPKRSADPGDGRAGIRPQHADHGRGRRNPGRAACWCGAWLFARPGLHFRKADADGGGAQLAAKGAATRPAQLPPASRGSA